MTAYQVLGKLLVYLLEVAGSIATGQYEESWAESTLIRVYDILQEWKK